MGTLAMLRALPWRWIGVALLVVAIAGAFAVQRMTIAGLRADVAKGQTELAQEREARQKDRADAASTALAKDQEYRAREAQLRKDYEEKVNASEQLAARERADRVIADAAAGRLQQRFNALVADARRAAQDSLPASRSAAAEAGDMQSDMFRRVLEVAGQYRDAAADALRRGELCETLYDGAEHALSGP